MKSKKMKIIKITHPYGLNQIQHDERMRYVNGEKEEKDYHDVSPEVLDEISRENIEAILNGCLDNVDLDDPDREI